MQSSDSPGRFPKTLFTRCPATFPVAIEKAATRQCMTPAEYVRRSIVERLRADGIDPSSAEAVG
jgi:hypothetical protein